MGIRTMQVILLYTFLTYTVYGNTVPYTVQLSDLFRNYSPVFKPRKDLSQSVLVNATLHLKFISEISERLQTMRFTAWFNIQWVDEFLILSEDVQSLTIPRKDIWYPDVSIYDLIDDPQTISDGAHVLLFQNGRVYWFPGGEYVIRCGIDIRRYPFDSQVCNLRVGAWHNSGWTQQFLASETGLDISNFIENGEWEITKTTVQQLNTDYNTSVIWYHIYVKRRHLHPVLNTLVPVIMLSFLNTLVFLLPANSGEKMTLCISVLLSFTVFLTVFNDTMPKMSTTISYLSVYLVVQLGMSVVAIVMSIIVWRTENYKITNDKKVDLAEHTSHMNHEENNKTIHTNREDIGSSRLSLHLPKYLNSMQGNIPIDGGEVDFDGEETAYHIYRNTGKGRQSTRNLQRRIAVYPSCKYVVENRKTGKDASWNTEQLDRIMFRITFTLVLGSTIGLFIALLV